MFNKIYLAVFFVALLVMVSLTIFAYTQLQSIGFPPIQIVQNFESYDFIHKTALWISSLILLVLANIILWTYRKSWSLWLTFGYFAVFLLLNFWWLGESLVSYKKANNLWDGGFSIGGLVAAIFCVVVGIGIFFNQFLVLRMRDKMFDKPTAEISTISIEENSEKPIEEKTVEENSAEEVQK